MAVTMLSYTCLQCGVSFTRHKGFPCTGKFCSRKCAGIAHRGAGCKSGDGVNTRRSSRIVPCQWCGEGFHPIHGRDAASKYCSIRCRDLGRTRPPNHISSVDAAWLAALVDGEGSVVLPRGRVAGSVLIVNTCRPLLDRAREVTGIGMITSRASSNPNHLTVCKWTVSGLNAGLLLERMLPRLIIKRDRAMTVIAFYNSRRLDKKGSPENAPPPD